MAELRRGRWVVRELIKRGKVWYVHLRDTRTGRVRKVSTKKTRKSWAEEQIDVIIDRLEAKEKMPVDVPSVDTAYRQWVDSKSLRPTTRASYLLNLSNFGRAIDTARPVSEVTPADCNRFFAKHKDLAGRTRQKLTASLVSFLRWCVGMRYIDRSPAEGVAPVVRVRGQKRDPVLSVNDARAFLSACREAYEVEKEDKNGRRWTETWTPPRDLYVAALVGLYTGLRQTNLFSFTQGHLDLELGWLFIPGAEMKAGEDHEIPLRPELVDILRGYDLPLVVNPRTIRKARKRAGLPGVTWRSLRRTFATWLEDCCTYACLQSLLAHSRTATVTGRYVDVSWEQKVAAIAQLPELVEAGAEASSEGMSGERFHE